MRRQESSSARGRIHPALALVVAVFAYTAALAACGQSTEGASSGAALYANNCASCHGAQGEGDGPVAAVMKVGVPNLRNLSLRNNGKFPTDEVRTYIDGRKVPAAHGDRYMPIWGNEFGYGAKSDEAAEKQIAERIDAIVAYLRSIQYR